MQANGAIVPDGDYNVEFKVYNTVTSSGSTQGSCSGDATCLWTETRVSTNKVRVVNGYLTVNLGSVAALPAINWDQELWLTMNIGGTGTPGWDGEMSPRLKLTAVPYAFTAGQLAATNGSFRSNLSFVQPTANRSILIPDASGTICLQNSAACGFLTGSAGDYIQNNQTGSPQSANIFIQNAGANSADTATLKLGASQTGAALNITDSSNNSLWKITSSLVTQTVGLRLSVNSTTADTFVTPGGASVKSAINIPLYDPGAFGQLLAFGLPSGAQTSSRAISVFDARTSGVIQPAIALFSPNENEVFGLSWNGLNTVASLESSGSTAIALRPGGVNVKLWAGSTGVAIGNNVSSASYPLDVTGDINTSTQYRIAGTVICTASGCTPASGSGNYIQNQNASDQTANFRIDGTGRAGTALQAPLFDTPTAATLNIGTTNATSIELKKSTVVTGGLTQSTGAVSLSANGASSFTTSSGALTITAAAASTWSTSAGALTIQSATTNALNLRTAGAGTVAVGDINSTTIQIGRGSDIARTIHIGNAGTTTAQTIVMGSTGSTSTTTIQGGTGTSAIALTSGTNGGIRLTSNGTGAINLTSGTGGVIVKPTADAGSIFQVQNAGGSYIFNVNSTFGIVNIGLLNVGIGTNTGFIDTTNSGDTVTIGATNAGVVTIGRAASVTTIQGDATTTIKATSGSFTTTVGFTAPTANRTITMPDEGGVVCIRNSVNCGFLTGSAANYIQNTTTLQSANIAVQAATSGSVTAVLQANAAGTADILQLKNGAGTSIATFGYNGQILFKNSTNSVTAFEVQNAAGASVLTVDTSFKRVGIGNATPTVDLDVGPSTMGVGQIVQIRIGDFLLQSQQGGANGLAALTSRGSNGNLTLDGASGGALYLAPFTTNNIYLATGGGNVAVGNVGTPALKFEVQGGDAAIYNNGNNARLVLGDSSTSGQYGWLQWDSANDYFRIETAGTNGLKIKDNNVSIGNIFPSKPLIVGAGTTALFEVGATGQIQSRTSTNTTTAFQLQNDVSGVYFNGDSTNKRIGIGANMIAPEVTLDVAGAIQQTGLQTSDTGAADSNKWTKLGTCTLTTQFTQCLATLSIVGGHDGSTGNNTQATVSVRVKQQNAMGGVPYVNVNLNDTAEVITKSDIVAVTTVNTVGATTVELYGRITNTFEHWAYTPIINNGNGAASTWDWTPTSGFIAALPGGTQNVARYGNLNANLMMVESTDTNAFTVQNAGGVNKLLVANTNLMRLAVNQATAAYTLDVAGDINTTTQLRIAGTSICDTTGCTAKTGSGFYIHNQTTVQASNFWVQAATTGTVAGIIQAFNGGTADILQLKNGAGTNVAIFGSAGAVTLQNSTNSTAAFQISAVNTNAVMRVDTTNERVAIGVISDPISAKLNIATSSTVSLRAYQGSTFDAFQLANSTGDIFNVSDTGEVNVKTTTNSANALRIQNSSSAQVFSVDSIDGIVMLGTGFGAKHIAMDIETNPYIELVDSTGTNGVGLTQVEGGSAYLNHDSDLIVQRATTSATDFRVLSPTDDSNLFTVDSANSRIVLGASNTTGTLLVLDTKTDAGDPTGVNGGMYYNSSLAKLRCYENSAWRNCNNGDAESLNTISGAAGTAMSKAATGTIIITPVYIPGRMTVNELRVNVVTTALGAAGDIGLYNSAGTLVLNGGSSSVSVGTGLKTVTPTQAAGARIMEPGQYYMAVTWNATTGTISSISQSANLIKRNGTITGGGLVLPASLTLSGITTAAGIPAFGLAN